MEKKYVKALTYECMDRQTTIIYTGLYDRTENELKIESRLVFKKEEDEWKIKQITKQERKQKFTKPEITNMPWKNILLKGMYTVMEAKK